MQLRHEVKHALPRRTCDEEVFLTNCIDQFFVIFNAIFFFQNKDDQRRIHIEQYSCVLQKHAESISGRATEGALVDGPK